MTASLAEIADAAADVLAEIADAADAAVDVLAEIADAAAASAADVDLPIAPAGEEILNRAYGLTFYNSKSNIPVEPLVVAEPSVPLPTWDQPGWSPAMLGNNLSWSGSSVNVPHVF